MGCYRYFPITIFVSRYNENKKKISSQEFIFIYFHTKNKSQIHACTDCNNFIPIYLKF